MSHRQDAFSFCFGLTDKSGEAGACPDAVYNLSRAAFPKRCPEKMKISEISGEGTYK